MAPIKQPISLFKMSLKAVVLLINETCINLHKTYGNFNPVLCKDDITNIQNYLLLYIPGNILDQVCNEWVEISWYLCDAKYHVAIYMHRHMRNLNFSRNDLRLACASSFWETQLYQANSIVCLNLEYMCTDSVLEVVGEHCHNLKYINILLSYIGSASNVSDEGLRHLGKCKKLKAVEMDLDIVKKSLDKVSVGGISQLIKNLPVAKYIPFGNMGAVLSENMDDVESLLLTHFFETRPIVDHILSVSRLCPCLSYMYLSHCFSESDILNTINGSSLKLLTLHLNSFNGSLAFFNFLIVKGVYLTTLILKGNVKESLVPVIGKYCPNIEFLSLRRKSRISSSDRYILPSSREAMFSKLETLKLYGSIHTERTLQTILIPAKKVKVLVLDPLNNYNSFDYVFNDIFSKNPLTELTEVHVKCNLSKEMILYFYRCPNMRKLFLRNNDAGFTLEDVHKLEKEIVQNNLDIKVFFSFR